MLSSHSVSTWVSELEEIPYYEVSTDASDHKAEKYFLLLFNILKKMIILPVK